MACLLPNSGIVKVVFPLKSSLSDTCTRSTPTVNLTPQSQTDMAGSTLSYDLNITNNGTTNCSDSSWELSTQIPSEWSETMTANTITIAPGNSTTVNWQVSSVGTAADNNYTLPFDLVDAGIDTHDKSMYANYTITTPGDTELPSAPANLTAAVERKKIAVSWQPSSDNIAVAGYHVYRNNSQIAIATTSSTSYNDSNLIKGETYTYHAMAFDAAKNLSSISNTSSVTFGK